MIQTAAVHSRAGRAFSTGQPTVSSNARSRGASPAQRMKWERPSARSTNVLMVRVCGVVMLAIYVIGTNGVSGDYLSAGVSQVYYS